MWLKYGLGGWDGLKNEDKHIYIYILLCVAQLVKNQPAMCKTPVQFLGLEDPQENG